MKAKWLKGILVGIVLLVLIVPLANFILWKQIEVPPEEPVDVVWTDQNWQPEEWQWWYHIAQGSGLTVPVPYKWFLALEQPKLSLFKPASKFIDPEFIGRFGFLADDKNAYNPDGIPVGFTKTENFIDFGSDNREPQTVVGLTCAACHTGQINYEGKGIRIEGGPNMVALDKFETAFGLALGLTYFDPLHFNRFANSVLGEDASAAERKELKQHLKAIIDRGLKINKDQKDLFPTEEGFGRTDALARIGNFVFGTQINPENYRKATGPVNFPHIWNVPWFNWAQYDGSVSQPMARNGGEALGVFATVDLDPDSPTAFQSNIDVEGLYEIERLLSGDTDENYGKINRTNIFETGLTSPQWPEEILGEIDQTKVAMGKQVYQQNCQSCHLPPVGDKQLMNDQYWENIGKNIDREYLKMTMKNLYEIGTDPETAVNWNQRIANIGDMASEDYDYFEHHGVGEDDIQYRYNGVVEAGLALKYVGQKAIGLKYQELGLTPEQQEAYSGFRPDYPRAPLAYKARPLNGIWATAPFLHNGSVPNLYEMLVPVEQRSQKFYLGTREFDPKYVGFKKDKISGATLLDTSKIGNSNAGHEFKGDGSGEGVIGPELSEDERWALVEYLKTL